MDQGKAAGRNCAVPESKGAGLELKSDGRAWRGRCRTKAVADQRGERAPPDQPTSGSAQYRGSLSQIARDVGTGVIRAMPGKTCRLAAQSSGFRC